MITLLSTFFVISLTGALSPGPLTTMAITEGARRGKWSGWWLSLGHGLIEGALVAAITAAILFGREAILEQPLVGRTIAIVGGGFLAWMGWGLLSGAWQRRLTLRVAAEPEGPRLSQLRLVSEGALFSVSNPYWWVWWAIVPPVFIRDALVWSVAGVAVLYFTHWLSDLFWLTGLSYLTGSGRSLVSERTYRWVLIGCGLVLIVFGIIFVTAGIRGEVRIG